LPFFPVEDIQRFVPRHAKQPAGRVVGNAPVLPLGKGLGERVLHDVLRQVEIIRSEDPGQDSDQLPRLVPEEVVDKLMDGRLVDDGIFRQM